MADLRSHLPISSELFRLEDGFRLRSNMADFSISEDIKLLTISIGLFSEGQKLAAMKIVGGIFEPVRVILAYFTKYGMRYAG